MSDDDFFEDADVDLGEAPLADVVPYDPPAPTSAELERIPSKPTANWVKQQVAPRDWRRSRVLTPELVVYMHKLIGRGLSQRAVCARAGITQGTWREWERKAYQELEPYTTWYRMMAAATAELEDELIDNVRGAAQSDWKAATWLLGKINREDYGENKGSFTTNVHIEGDVGDKQTVNSIDDKEAEKIARLMAKIGALPSAEVIEGEVVEDAE